MIGALFLAFALGAVVSAIMLSAGLSSANDTAVPSTPKSQLPLSGEAYQGCLTIGMTSTEIAEDPTECLTSYWTPERLKQFDTVRAAWEKHNGQGDRCREMNGQTVCELTAPADPIPFPPADDPWWIEQALAEPGRKSISPGIYLNQ